MCKKCTLQAEGSSVQRWQQTYRCVSVRVVPGKNKHRFKKNGEVKINDNVLVALALLVAQSDPAEKELMIQLIINLINNR